MFYPPFYSHRETPKVRVVNNTKFNTPELGDVYQDENDVFEVTNPALTYHVGEMKMNGKPVYYTVDDAIQIRETKESEPILTFPLNTRVDRLMSTIKLSQYPTEWSVLLSCLRSLDNKYNVHLSCSFCVDDPRDTKRLIRIMINEKLSYGDTDGVLALHDGSESRLAEIEELMKTHKIVHVYDGDNDQDEYYTYFGKFYTKHRKYIHNYHSLITRGEGVNKNHVDFVDDIIKITGM